MLDLNPLRASAPPNDAAYAIVITGYMYGPMDAAAQKVLAQARRGLISCRFGMIALARLNHRREIARRTLLDACQPQAVSSGRL